MNVSKHIYFLLFLITFPVLVFSQNIQEDDSLSYYNFIAKKELDSANYKKAVSIADRAIKEGYVSNKILKTRAIANYKLRQTKKAFLDIEEIIMSDEDNLDISPLISLYYINIESPNNAISILVNSFNEDNKTFFHSLSLINEREFKIIIQAIDNTMTSEDYPKALYGIKSMINYTFKNYNDSYTDLITALEGDQTNGMLYYIMGEIKLKRKEYISALASFNSAILYNETSTTTYKQRAIAKGFLNDFKGALEDYDIILKREPQNAEIFYLRAIAKNYLADYNGALSDLNRAISISDTFSSAYNYRGIVYINLGDYGSSLIDFYKTLSYNPNHPFTHNNIGIALIKTGQSTKAEEFFTKAIQLDKKHADAYYNRGKLLLEKKNIIKAKQDLLTTLELNYQNPDAHYLLALIYIDEKSKNPRLKLEDKICSELEIASGMQHPKAIELFNKTCQKIEPEPQEEVEEPLPEETQEEPFKVN